MLFSRLIYSQSVVLRPLAQRRPSVGDIAVTTHNSVGGSGATVQVVMGLRAMGNGLNESGKAASSQDLLRN